MSDPTRIAVDIQNKEDILKETTDSNLREQRESEIHNLQVEIQTEIASEVGEDFDPAEDK